MAQQERSYTLDQLIEKAANDIYPDEPFPTGDIEELQHDVVDILIELDKGDASQLDCEFYKHKMTPGEVHYEKWNLRPLIDATYQLQRATDTVVDDIAKHIHESGVFHRFLLKFNKEKAAAAQKRKIKQQVKQEVKKRMKLSMTEIEKAM